MVVVVSMLIVVMGMSSVAMVVAAMAKNDKAYEVRCETAASNDEDDLGVGDLRGVDETSDRLEYD